MLSLDAILPVGDPPLLCVQFRQASEIRSVREEAAAARAALARVQEQAAGWEEALAAKEREAANLQVR